MVRITFVVSLVLVPALFVIGACGAEEELGPELSREEYFRELQWRFDEWHDAFDDDDPALFEDPSDEEELAAFVAFYERAAVVAEGLARDLSSLRPPASLAEPHSELVAAVEGLATAARGIAQESRAVDPLDVDAFRDEVPAFDDLKAASERGEVACRALEDASAGGFSCFPEVMRGGVECFSDIDVIGDGIGDCSSDGPEINIAPGMSGRLAEMPPVPEGLEALTQYIEFDADYSDTETVIGMPLKEPVADATGLWWYSYDNGEWLRLDVAVLLVQAGTTAEGDFEAIPASLVILREK
jgi:hypothetical protein